MLYDEIVFGGADPGANLGGTFTSSLNERELVTKGAYLHEIILGLKHDNATAANTAEDSLNILNPFTFKVGQEVRIQLRGRDLAALHYFFHRSLPRLFEADAATDDFKVSGLRIPIWEKVDAKQTYAWSATRTALTNASGEVLEVAARWSDKALMPQPIIAVEQPFTSAAATGRTNLNIEIPQLGDLIGLIMFNTTAPSNTADTATIQRLQFLMNGERKSLFSWGARGDSGYSGLAAQDQPPHDVLRNYMFVDLREDPIDLKTSKIGVEVDVQATSEACRLIPIIAKK